MILDKTKTIIYDNNKIKNILTNIPSIYSEIKSKVFTQTYLISPPMRPEELSYHLYKTPHFEWVLLLINNVIDPFWDWPQADEVISEMAQHKYSSLDEDFFPGVDHIHHYYNPLDEEDIYWDIIEYPNATGYYYHIGDLTHSHPQFIGDLVPVTNLEYELNLNDNRKLIKIIPPQNMKAFNSYMINALKAYG